MSRNASCLILNGLSFPSPPRSTAPRSPSSSSAPKHTSLAVKTYHELQWMMFYTLST